LEFIMAIYETRKGRIVGVIQTQAPVERQASNRRMTPRRRSTLPGMIYPDGRKSPITCTISDMSVTGARLTLKGADASDTVNTLDLCLLVLRHDRVMYQCKVVRRGTSDVGVQFLSAARPLPENGRGN
jgi:hypothetical protein